MYRYTLDVVQVDPQDLIEALSMEGGEAHLEVVCRAGSVTCRCTKIPTTFTVRSAPSENTLSFTLHSGTPVLKGGDSVQSNVIAASASDIPIGGLHRRVGACSVPLFKDPKSAEHRKGALTIMWEVSEEDGTVFESSACISTCQRTSGGEVAVTHAATQTPDNGECAVPVASSDGSDRAGGSPNAFADPFAATATLVSVEEDHIAPSKLVPALITSESARGRSSFLARAADISAAPAADVPETNPEGARTTDHATFVMQTVEEMYTPYKLRGMRNLQFSVPGNEAIGSLTHQEVVHFLLGQSSQDTNKQACDVKVESAAHTADSHHLASPAPPGRSIDYYCTSTQRADLGGRAYLNLYTTPSPLYLAAPNGKENANTAFSDEAIRALLPTRKQPGYLQWLTASALESIRADRTCMSEGASAAIELQPSVESVPVVERDMNGKPTWSAPRRLSVGALGGEGGRCHPLDDDSVLQLLKERAFLRSQKQSIYKTFD